MLKQEIIDEFHKIHYAMCLGAFPKFLGVTIEKTPLDLWIYQEIIFDTKPEVIIETGTRYGGSALFFACLFDLIDSGLVITIDTEDMSSVYHPRMVKLIGNSISDDIVNTVRELVGNRTVLVSLDSAHVKDHVLKEMKIYSEFVTVGNYMIVEDTNINGHPVLPTWSEGPMEAVNEFLSTRNDFEIDKSRERFLVTSCPNGFLKRVEQ